jgi:hypothetical protein
MEQLSLAGGRDDAGRSLAPLGRADGVVWLVIDMSSEIGALVAECGFEVWDRSDGVVPEGAANNPSKYKEHLKAQGYEGHNPWHTAANSGQSDDGDVLSGWLLKHATEPAAVADEDSETPYATTRPHLRHLSPNAKSCLLTMVFDGRWKMVWVEGHRPIL